jgi:uncharacterized protein YukE
MADVKMNYDSMDAMQKAFQKANQQLQDSMTQMGKVSKTLEDGALLGSAGDAFRDAINSKLLKRMKVIADKIAELGNTDIPGAVSKTRDGVSTAKGRFNN